MVKSPNHQEGKGRMHQISDSVYAFPWFSTHSNNCNAYLINGPTRILIDPGHSNEFGHVEEAMRDLGLGIKDIGIILCTHAHPDHIEAVERFAGRPALFAIHHLDWQLARSMNAYTFLGLKQNFPQPDLFLTQGGLRIHGIDLQIWHTPGHSPGSVSIYWPEQKILFTGDLIFKQGIGRTDLPGGNGGQLKESIQRLKSLETKWLLPGHGEIIEGADQVRDNFDHIERYWFQHL